MMALAFLLLLLDHPEMGMGLMTVGAFALRDFNNPVNPSRRQPLGIAGFANFGDNIPALSATPQSGFTHAFPYIENLNIVARDVTSNHNDMICKRKIAMQGGGKSKGRKCYLNNKLYFMKYDLQGDRIREYYNLMLAKTLGIQIPKAEFIIDKTPIQGSLSELLFASEEIPRFLSAYDIKNSSTTQTQFRKAVNSKIGSEGIARLTVAQGFIADLYVGNWGVMDSELILMDVDGGFMQPSTLSGYLALGSSVHFQVSNNEPEKNLDQLSLTPNNVIDMKKILESLRNVSPPKLHESVDMSDEFFQTLVNIYIKACDNTIEKLNLINATEEPSIAINILLAAEIRRMDDDIIAVTHGTFKQSATEININIPELSLTPKIKTLDNINNTQSTNTSTSSNKQTISPVELTTETNSQTEAAKNDEVSTAKFTTNNTNKRRVLFLANQSDAAPSPIYVSMISITILIGLLMRHKKQSAKEPVKIANVLTFFKAAPKKEAVVEVVICPKYASLA